MQTGKTRAAELTQEQIEQARRLMAAGVQPKDVGPLLVPPVSRCHFYSKVYASGLELKRTPPRYDLVARGLTTVMIPGPTLTENLPAEEEKITCPV